MLIVIPNILDKKTLAVFREQLQTAQWVDGQQTAGTLSGRVKRNRQLPETAPVAIALGNMLLGLLGRHPLFLSAALPQRIYPPKFNRYGQGECYGTHVDSAIMPLPDGQLLRSDLSATLFLSEPDDYDGGELTIETAFGAQAVKLAAGDMVLYPSSSLHQVTPVTRGERVCSFFWIQSMVQDEIQRSLLFELDQSIQSLTASATSQQDAPILRLTSVYHNLLRSCAL